MQLAVSNLQVRFGGTQVLRGITLEFGAGLSGIVGPNGSGKSTLLRSLVGAVGSGARTTGEVTLDGRSLRQLRRVEIARRVALVVQEHGSDLDGTAELSVREFVTLGRLPWQGFAGRVRGDDAAIVSAALNAVGLGVASGTMDRSITQLSGGERQRAHLARALAQKTQALLLDEPTNHLDVRYQHELMTLLARLTREASTSVVVLHDLNLAAQFCDRLIVVDAGRVVADGSPSTVIDPEILEPIYGIGMTRTEVTLESGRVCPQLLFHSSF